MADKKQLIGALRDLGIKENEAEVYTAALSLGPTTALKIARTSGVKRSTVYEALETLAARGYVSMVERGLKRLYVAESPTRLEQELTRRREQFHSLLPEFEALFNLRGNESVIRYYDSIESLKSEYEDLLHILKNKDEYFVYGDPTRWQLSEKDFFKDYIKRRIRINLDARLILSDSALAREYQQFERNFNEKVRLLPEGVQLDMNVTMTRHKIIIHQLIEPVLTIVIENRSLISMQMALFKIMWDKLS